MNTIDEESRNSVKLLQQNSAGVLLSARKFAKSETSANLLVLVSRYRYKFGAGCRIVVVPVPHIFYTGR